MTRSVRGRASRASPTVRTLTQAADAEIQQFARNLPVVRAPSSNPHVRTREAVLAAIAEYDKLGQRAFLKKYGYWKAKAYVLVHAGKRYDSKAIYGAARGFEQPSLGPLGAKEFGGGERTVQSWLRALDFRVDRIRGAARAQALVLASQEETSGGEFDFWEDREGVTHHFPNKYHNLVQPGLPFVYYRGVRRRGVKRGEPEYFGVGRIGEVWVDPARAASRPSDRRWFCSIEDYREFAGPVSWKHEGTLLEGIKKNQFRDGVRWLPLESFEKICQLAGVTLATPPQLPDLPEIGDVVLTPAPTGGSLLTTVSRTGMPGEPARTRVPARRSRFANQIGHHAELLVRRELERQGKKGVRHLSAEGLIPGYDLEYRDRGRLVAIEVKGTTGRQFTNFELTEREREAAELHGRAYQVWLVAGVGSTQPTFEVIEDPTRRFERGDWTKTPLLWRVERSSEL